MPYLSPHVRRLGHRIGSELVTVKPAPGAHRGAIRIGVTNLLVLVVLVPTGRLDLAVYATFGAFVCVYGGRWPQPGRWRTQTGMAAVMVSAVILGALVALSPARTSLAIPVTAVASAVAAVAAIRGRWVPPGPFFVTFAVATCASIPTTVTTLGLALVVAAATAGLAVLLGAIEERTFPAPAGSPAPGAADPRQASDEQRVAARSALAVVTSGVIATASGIGHPYWAMVASVAVMAGTTVEHQLARGVQRGIGTTVGMLPAWALLAAPIPLRAVPFVVATLQGLVDLFIPRNYALGLVFITPLALFVGQLADPIPVSELLTDRLLETLIGVAVGCLSVVLLRDRAHGRRPDM